jgi:hypothetical protein
MDNKTFGKVISEQARRFDTDPILDLTYDLLKQNFASFDNYNFETNAKLQSQNSFASPKKVARVPPYAYNINERELHLRTFKMSENGELANNSSFKHNPLLSEKSEIYATSIQNYDIKSYPHQSQRIDGCNPLENASVYQSSADSCLATFVEKAETGVLH